MTKTASEIQLDNQQLNNQEPDSQSEKTKRKYQKRQTQPSVDFSIDIDKDGAEQIKTEYDERTKVKEDKPKRQTKAEREQIAGMVSAFTTTVIVALDIVCQRMPEPKALSSLEKQMIEAPIESTLEKYAPVMLTYGPEVSLLFGVIFILMPRMKFKKKKDKETELVTE